MIEPRTASAPPGFRISPQLILGFCVIIAGVILLLDQLGITPVVTYLRFWPMVLVVIGVLKMLQARDGGGAVAGLVFALVGAWLQAEMLGLIHISLRDVWPAALVVFGAFLVWHALSRRDTRPAAPPFPYADPVPPPDRPAEPVWGESATPPAAEPEVKAQPKTSRCCVGGKTTRLTDTNSSLSAVAVLGAVSRGNNSKSFRRADIMAIMGGCEIDLRHAAIHGEAIIDVLALWGGVEIRVPEDWTVVSRIVPLMGGVEDKTRPPQGLVEHRLVLRGVAIMGGIEIRN
jgi:predicted membrane protein